MFNFKGFSKSSNPESGKELYERSQEMARTGRNREYLELLGMAAEADFADAQFEYADAIRRGEVSGTDSDVVKWLEKAATQNHLYAINNLAMCYQLGQGVKNDFMMAALLLKKASALGDFMADFNLGQTYLFGIGVKPNLKTGMDFLNKAVRAGSSDAQFLLGQLYEKGIIIDDERFATDMNEAVHWYRLAAAGGNQKAMSALEDLGVFNNKDIVPELIIHSEDGELGINLHAINPEKYDLYCSDYARISDIFPILLMKADENKDSLASEVLAEIIGNYSYKPAFKALYRSGKVHHEADDATRMGYARFMMESWLKWDKEKLEIMAFWAYPSFGYREIDSDRNVLYSTNSEKDFVAHIMDNMIEAHEKNLSVKARIDQYKEGYITLVNIGGKISAFSFIFKNNNFVAIERLFLRNNQ